jgi:hypothetical protein
MSAILRIFAAMILAAALAGESRAGAAASTNAPPAMANPYPYAFFDPAKPSPQIVAPPKDWKLDTSDGWGWCPGGLFAWPCYGYGPWGPWWGPAWGPNWGMSWCPPYPYAPFSVYNLDVKIRF